MVRTAWVTVATAALIAGGAGVLSPAGSANAYEDGGYRCTEATIKGPYGIQIQGTNAVPPNLGGGTQAVIGVVLRTYDGAGGFTQVDNVKGAVTGIVPDRPGAGTYQINDDCTGVILFQPAPGITIEERMVIVDGGREIRTIVSSPLSVMMSGVQQRVGPGSSPR